MKSIAGIVELAWAKFEDAELLLQQGRPDSAFYVGGYTIELLLKAMICKTIRIEDFFDFSDSTKKYLSKEAYRPFKVHDFLQLSVLAGIRKDVEKQLRNPEFYEHWSVIRKWSENSRYLTGKQEANVKSFLISIKTISKWIEKHLSAP